MLAGDALSITPVMPPTSGPSSGIDRFVASLNLDYEKWREGIGYDLDALQNLNAEERARVLALLQARLDRPGAGWREVEAIAALETDEARATLEALTQHENIEMRLRALRRLSSSGKGARIEKAVVRILRDPDADVSMKVDSIMTMAREHPTAAMQQALLFCAVDGAPDLRVHAAALALYLAGRAKEPFDWNFRPLFLEFGESDRTVRLSALGKLTALIRGAAMQA
jgi:hypothetical protein